MDRHTLWGVATLATALGLGAGCTGTFSAGPTAYGGGPSASARWQDPQFFSARVNDRLRTIEQHVRSDIASGMLPAESINDFHNRRAQIDQSLAQASSDGVIDPSERQQIRSLVQSAASIGSVHTGAYGQYGGQDYGYQYQQQAPRSYFDESWDWGL